MTVFSVYTSVLKSIRENKKLSTICYKFATRYLILIMLWRSWMIAFSYEFDFIKLHDISSKITKITTSEKWQNYGTDLDITDLLKALED